jgi:hypothetical protein
MSDDRGRVPLPDGAEPPLQVFVSGVPQVEGVDYDLVGHDLMFRKPLVKEKLGFWRWTAMFFALFGSYGRNDTVDVQYELGGRKTVASGLEFFPPEGTLPGS